MAQQDPTLMNATPSKKALLDSLNTQVKAQTANQYGYSPYQAVGRLPAQEQDAILGDMANQITYKANISVSKDDLKGLPAFNNTATISARKPSFLEGLADIGANLGEGIIQGVTGRTTDYYGNDLHDKFGILGSPNNEWVRNITAVPTGLAVGAGLTLASPLLGAGWFGATSANQAIEANQQASQEAGASGDFNQAQKIKDLQGQSAGIAGTAGALTSFLPAYLGKGLAKKALTGAGLGYAQDYATRKALDYATTGTADASLVAPEMGTLFGAGFPLAGAGLKKLAGKRAKITEAPSQKQAVEALQNEANNAPLASQRNRARAVLRRMNTEQSFNALEAPQPKQAVKKPVVVVPIKKKIKPPLQLPTKVVGGFKKKVVTPAEVAKPANVEAPTKKPLEYASPAKIKKDDLLRDSGVNYPDKKVLENLINQKKAIQQDPKSKNLWGYTPDAEMKLLKINEKIKEQKNSAEQVKIDEEKFLNRRGYTKNKNTVSEQPQTESPTVRKNRTVEQSVVAENATTEPVSSKMEQPQPKLQETAVEAKKREYKDLGKVPERPDGMTHKEHFYALNKEYGGGLERQAFNDGKIIVSEVKSQKEARAKAEKELSDKPISQLSDAGLIEKVKKRVADIETEKPTIETTKKNRILLNELKDRVFNAEKELPEIEKALDDLVVANSGQAKKSGQASASAETKTSVEKAIEVLQQYSKESPDKLKADAEAVKQRAKTVTEEELKAPKAFEAD
jgi:hypothetical protein